MKKITIIFVILLLVGCGKKVELQSNDGTVSFSYDCNNIKQQMKTGKDLSALRSNIGRVISEMVKDNPVGARSLRDAVKRRDYVAAERMMVEYLCSK